MNFLSRWMSRVPVILSLVVLLCAAPGLTGSASARPLLLDVDDAISTEQSPNPTVEAGTVFQVYFSMTNTGTTTWQPGSYWFQNQEGAMGADPVQPLTGGAVIPGGFSVWYVNLTAPATAGIFRTSWRLSHNNVDFGQLVFIDVTVKVTNLSVTIAGTEVGSYYLQPSQQMRVNYAGIDSGPVVVEGRNGMPIIAALRDSWNNGTNWTSYAQLMGLPAGQLSTKYVFPSYNNVSLDEQLRFGNVGTAATTVTVTIAGVVRGQYVLQPSQQQRVNYAGLDSGPVVVESSGSVPIIAAIRDSWWDGTAWTSFVQMMGLPAGQISTKYVFPSYNNVSLDEQIRFGNVGTAATTVTVKIAGVVRGTYFLNPSQQQRVNYVGLDSGPVVVESSGNVPIIAAIRDSWWNGTKWTSYSQLMGLPAGQISTKYVFPSYNNVTVDEQLRFGNVGTADTTVTVTIGGVVRGTYLLHPSQQLRLYYAGLDSGPVVVESSGGVPIIAALRDSWWDGSTWTSFIQTMGLPGGLLSDKYMFPSYNNVSLDEQVRFGVP